MCSDDADPSLTADLLGFARAVWELTWPVIPAVAVMVWALRH